MEIQLGRVCDTFAWQFLSWWDEALSERIHGEHTSIITPYFLYHSIATHMPPILFIINCYFGPIFWCAYLYKANRIKKATIRQKRPMASDRAKPRMAYVKSCCLSDGLRA